MNRLKTISTRMGPDLRDAIEVMPGLGGIALWVRFLDSDDPELIARTDGIHVEAGPRYCEYDALERRFILLHELLHVALAHPARARDMKKRCRDFDQYLYNIACDAIVNAALDGVRGILAPGGSVTLEKVLTLIGLWKKDDRLGEVVRRWSSEALYLAMDRSGKQADLRALGTGSNLNNDDIVSTPGSPEVECSQKREDISTEDTIRAWSLRLAAARGALAGILNRLALDLPRVGTPWERIAGPALPSLPAQAQARPLAPLSQVAGPRKLFERAGRRRASL